MFISTGFVDKTILNNDILKKLFNMIYFFKIESKNSIFYFY
jgi:hypothetical protein